MDPLSVLPLEIILDHIIIPSFDFVEICSFRQVSSTWKEIVNIYLSKLKHLDFTDLKDILTDSGFFSIVSELSRLEEICLNSCWIFANKYNLFELFSCCRGIKSFSAKHCKYVDDEVLEKLAADCKNLEYLNVSNCFQITSTGMKAVFRGCQNLEVCFTSRNYGFTDNAVKFIGENSESLRELDAGFCYYVTDEGLQVLLDGCCKKLSYLRITGCSKVSNEMVQKFVEKGIIVNNCY